MIRKKLERVHGHRFPELASLIQTSWTEVSEEIVISPYSLGGWTNVNLILENDEMKYVVRLPELRTPYKENPYTYEFEIMKYISQYSLCPKPIFLGTLDDDNQTPFMIMDYVEGVVRNNESEITKEELALLGSHLRQFSLLKPPNIASYFQPSELLNANIFRSIRLLDDDVELTSKLRSSIKMLHTLSSGIGDYLDQYCHWENSLMHGDLWEPNTVFQENSVIFLDLQYCAVGSTSYDLAYLLSQPVNPISVLNHMGYSNPVILRNVETLIPLALISLIVWSLEKLYRTEVGLLEENMYPSEGYNNLVSYMDVKMKDLAHRTKDWSN